MKVILQNSELVFKVHEITYLEPTQTITSKLLASNGSLTGGVSAAFYIDIYSLEAGKTYRLASVPDWENNSALSTTIAAIPSTELKDRGSISGTPIATYAINTASAFEVDYTPQENCYLYVSKFIGSTAGKIEFIVSR